MKTWWKKCAAIIAVATAFSLSNTAEAKIRNLLESENSIYAIRVMPKKDLVFFDTFFRASRIEISQNSIPTSEIELEDKIITSAVLLDFDRALVSGSKGSLYLIDLQKGKLIEELKISNKTQHLLKSPTKQIFASEGLLAIEKIRSISLNPDLKVKATLDVEKELGLDSSIVSGPEVLHFFANGSSALLNRKGKILLIDQNLNIKTVKTSPVSLKQTFRSHYDLTQFNSDSFFVIGDDLSLTFVNSAQNVLQVESPIRNYLPKLNQSLQREIKIESEASPTCRTVYSEYIVNSKKSQLYVRILTGAVVLINPVVGIGGVLFNESDLMFNWDSIDHALLVLKILNDAALDLPSEEIALLTEILHKYDSRRFANEQAIRAKINDLNQSKQACDKSLSTIKDLMVLLIKE